MRWFRTALLVVLALLLLAALGVRVLLGQVRDISPRDLELPALALDATVPEGLVRNLATSGDGLIVNDDREVVGEAGGGHISPLSTYDADTDTVLLLDTASYTYPPQGVPVERLFDAMNTPDSDSGRSHGWAVVR